MKRNTRSAYFGIIAALGVCAMLLAAPVVVSAQGDPGQAVVDLDYKDASLSAVLRSLSYSYDLNLVATKDVKGNVTVSLRNVTIDEALEAILSVNGYAFTRKGNLIYITPGPGTEGLDLITKPMHLSYLTAPEAERLVTKILSSKGDIQVNEATNSLVVTDYPVNIKKIENILRDVDLPPVQVLIEAKILDIEAKAFENLGTTITIDYDPQGSVSQGLFDRATNFDESLDVATSLAGPSSTLSGGQMTITTTLKDMTITTTLDALVQDNKAHLLASPSIATLNGKEARIIIGEKFPYKEKTQTTTGTTETTKFIDVGTTLRVTPMVSPDGMITMNVHPEVSSVSQTLDAGPRITTREADAVVRVRDGETIIIGGLISKKDDRIQGGIPILRRLPLFGALFSKSSKDLEEKELAVFITPRIIRAKDDMVAKKDVVDEEIYLSIDGTGKLNLVGKLLEHAKNLERKGSPESANKSVVHRKEEMLNTYKVVVTQFPEAEQADFALYKMGRLYFDYFKEFESARDTFERLVHEYPDSSYVDDAGTFKKRAEDALAQGN